jgi:hypothetical protein
MMMKKEIAYFGLFIALIPAALFLAGCETAADDDSKPPFSLANTVWIGETEPGASGEWATVAFKDGNEAVVLFSTDEDNSSNQRKSSYVYDNADSRGYLSGLRSTPSENWGGWFFLGNKNKTLELTNLKGNSRTLKRVLPDAGNTFDYGSVNLGSLSGIVWAGPGAEENEWITIAVKNNTTAIISKTSDNSSRIMAIGSGSIKGNGGSLTYNGLTLNRYR